MWTPRRMLLLVAGFTAFFAAYLAYAGALGGIDGLPPLPEEYWPSDLAVLEPLPPRSTETERKLREAFGNDEKVLGCPLKMEFRPRGMVLAAGSFSPHTDGRVLLQPFCLAIFGKGKAQGEIHTVRSKRAYIAFDQPVTNITQLNIRKIVGGELEDDIVITSNRRTPEKADDLCLLTQGPLYYQEDLHRIWTKVEVRLIDPQTRPEPMTVTATGADVFLTPPAAPTPGKPAAKSKGGPDGLSGVDRVVLQKHVDMNLWEDGRSGFLAAGDKAPKKNEPVASAKGVAKAPDKQSPVRPARVCIQTQGSFTYDVAADRAVFDVSPTSSPSPNHVHVRRINEVEGKLEQLVCDRLEMQFLRKTAKDAGAKNAGGVALEIASAHATGANVTLTSDSENLNAFGTDLLYEAKDRLTVLKGVPDMVAAKDGNFIYARELRLRQDAQGARQATARGPGRIELLDKASGNRPLHAVWRDELTYGRQGEVDLLVLTGEANFVDKDHNQQLFGDLIKVWLRPNAKDGAPAPKEEGQRPLPQQLEAAGRVRLNSPDLRIDGTDRLVVHFRDAVAAVSPRPSAVGQQPPAAKTEEPAKRTAAADARQPAPADGRKPKAESRKPLDLRARSVEAHVVRTGGKSDLEKLWCEGGVHVSQEPATPQEKGVDIRGDSLELIQHPGGNELSVRGDTPAKVQLDKLTMSGPQVNINQAENTAWVNGPGSMTLPSDTNFEGAKLTKPADLKIAWQKSMYFNGRLATFLGNVSAEQEAARLQTQSLQVHFDRPVSLKQGDKSKDAARVEKLICDQNVRVEDALREGGRLVSFKRIDARELDLDNQKDDGRATATGPGEVRLIQKGAKGGLLPAGPPGATPAKAEEEMKLTRVVFQGRMMARDADRTATFLDGVEVVHLPSDNPDLVIDLDRLPAGALYMRCAQLKVYSKQLPDKKTSQEMVAQGNVHVQANEFDAQANVVKYDEAKELVIFEGSPGSPARLNKYKARGLNPDHIDGEKILYSRRDNTYRVEGGTGLRFGN